MKNFSNIEIARIYKVSHVTVGNWIKLAIEGKNELEIEKKGKKFVILDIPKNRKEMELLVARGSKFRNGSGYKKTTINPQLYEIFSQSNLIELFTELDSKKMIPLKFTYLEQGADLYCEYSRKDEINGDYSYFNEEVRLFLSNINYLVDRLSNYSLVNVIDIGCGDGYLASQIVKELLSKEFTVKYTGMDISPRMLDIAEKNLKNKFPNLPIEKVVNDFDYLVIREQLFLNKLEETENSCNLILFIGSTIGNVYDRHRVLRNFYDSMYKDDILCINTDLRCFGEEEYIKHYLETPDNLGRLLWIPDLLGLEGEDYELLPKFDQKIDSWTLKMKLNKDIDIPIEIRGLEKEISLLKNEEITIWNFFSYPIKEITRELNEIGFNPVHFALSKNNTAALYLCQPDKATNLV